MPVTPTFPGIYIEELKSSAHTITAAPTSIAVFIGYTHPFKTLPQNFGKAVRVFDFTEYEREFGGLYRNTDLDSNVPYAVQQFFLNGGSAAYIVALKPRYYDATTHALLADFLPPVATIDNVVFEGLEPIDVNTTMEVTISNIQPTAPGPDQYTQADVTITYGSRGETFRKVPFDKLQATLAASSLAKVTSATGTAYVSPSITGSTATFAYSPAPPATAYSTSAPADFLAAFVTDGSLDKVDIFNLMAIPGVADNSIWSAAIAFCERKRAFLIIDPPSSSTADGMGLGLAKIEDDVNTIPKSNNAGLYFPYLTSIDALTAKPTRLPPSGYVAGVFARTDNNRGVWKAPAGLETNILNATGVVEEGRLTDARAGVLNEKSVNALRTFPGVGTVVFGARTLATLAFQEWRYVPVRRTALFIEQTLLRNLGWVVFEPNDNPLWVAIRASIEGFMLSLFRQGAFQGQKPSEAFLVKCDSSTTTQTDIDNGVVNILVGFRPLKPAEFVIIKIAQLAGQVQA